MSVLEVPLKQGLLASMTENRLLLELSDAPEGLSRSEIAQRTGISKPAISDAARRLEESGVIVSTGTRGGKRGGVATVYAINGDRGHSIAIALDSMSVSARVTTLDGTVVDELSERLPRGAGRSRVITTANTMLASIKSGLGSPLLATAVSMADPVDRNTGEIIVLADAVFPGGHINPLEDLHLDSANSSVDNDVNWATLAEHHVGTMKDNDEFVYVYLGAGLGAGLFIGGAVQRGARGLAGEIGQLQSPAGRDLTRRLAALGLGPTGETGGYGLDMENASTALSGGEFTAPVREALDIIANTISNIVTLLNSSAVVLGGPLASEKSLVDYLTAAIPPQTLDSVAVGVGRCTPLDGASYEAQRMARAAVGF